MSESDWAHWDEVRGYGYWMDDGAWWPCLAQVECDGFY